MAILFITYKFPPSIGGMEKQSYELINGIRRFEKVYYIIKTPGESNIVFFFLLLWRLNKRIKRYPDIKVIHCNDGVTASYCAILRKVIRIPITATIHGLDIVFPNWCFQHIVVPQLNHLAMVYTVSEATRVECLKRGFREDQIKVIHNGVDHDILHIRKNLQFREKLIYEYNIDTRGKHIIVSIGRAVKRKGFSWFVNNVFPSLPEDTIYIVIGPMASKSSIVTRIIDFLPKGLKSQVELFMGFPSDSTALKKAIEQESRCFHIGKIPYQRMIQLLSEASLFVMPNKKVDGDMEGFGLVALEANLAGTFVVASDLEGIRCAVTNGENGILVDSENRDEWIHTIGNLLIHPEQLAVISKQAKKFTFAHFSWNLMAEQYLAEFQKFEVSENFGKYQFTGLQH